MPTTCQIRLPALPDHVFAGELEQIGPVIDANQHTALVTGHVHNPRRKLTLCQFITASVNLPAPADEVEVPADAVVEDGRESIVFVQPDPARLVFVRRSVTVSRRFQDKIYLRGNPPPSQRLTMAYLALGL